jgi:hypothetical protein
MNSSALKSQFIGFINTPNLWAGDAVYGLNQLSLPPTSFENIVIDTPNLRLGKRVEQFVSEVLRKAPSSDVLAENVQIQKGKISIGELDCLLKQHNELIHLEIVFKFYLFDDKVDGKLDDPDGESGLSKWIGPNRNDDLVKKLTKLKVKQLPLLFKEETRQAIGEIADKLQIDLNPSNIIQNVLFKAQLFVPRKMISILFPTINNDCIVGFYIHLSELAELDSNTFYLPSKLNWLQEPSLNIEWLDMINFESQVQVFVNENRSPLCWLKDAKGAMQKFFVVWW